MATTIEQAVHPLFMTSSILGFGIYSPDKACISVLYNLIVWTAYFNIFYFMVTGFNLKTVLYKDYFDKINLIFEIITLLTSLTLSVYNDKRFRMFMKRLAAVDDTLKGLGTSMIYQKIHIYAKRLLIGWLMYTQTGNLFDSTWWVPITGTHWSIIIPFIANHFHHVNMFVDIQFVSFLWYIGTRFDKVNEHVRYLLVKEEHGLRCKWKKVVPITHVICGDNYNRVLWTSMHLHLELCQIARELNGMFAIQMTMEMLCYLLLLTKMFRNILEGVQINKYILSPLNWMDYQLWICMFVARLFGINYFCEHVSAKANEMREIIHNLTHVLRYAKIRNEIYQFTLQTIHHPLKFTGMGLFNFGNGFLHKFFMRITTFGIIIVQSVTLLHSANKDH